MGARWELDADGCTLGAEMGGGRATVTYRAYVARVEKPDGGTETRVFPMATSTIAEAEGWCESMLGWEDANVQS